MSSSVADVSAAPDNYSTEHAVTPHIYSIRDSSAFTQSPIIDTISVLSSSNTDAGDMVGVVKEQGGICLNQVLLNELQGRQHLHEHQTLTAQLHNPPRLTEHDLSVMDLAPVSSDPESLRFQYQPMEELMHQQPPSSSSSSPPMASKRKGSSQVKTVYREQDRFVPLHNVARIMRHAIPPNGKVSKDAKECMQECVSECVSFITSEASDKCIAEKRKTITGDDILYAMATLGFDNYVEPLKLYLQKYREFTRADKVNATTSPSTIPGDAI